MSSLPKLLEMCKEYYVQTDCTSIIELYKKSKADFDSSAWLLYYYGNALYLNAEYQSAGEVFLLCNQLAESRNEDWLLALGLLRLAECQNSLRKYDMSALYVGRTLTAFQNLKDKIGESRSSFVQGATSLLIGDYTNAEAILRNLSTYSKEVELLVSINCLINLSTLQDVSDKQNLAVATLLEALQQTYFCDKINSSLQGVQDFGYPIATHSGYVRVKYNTYKPQLNIYRALTSLLFRRGLVEESINYSQTGYDLIKQHGTTEQIVTWSNDLASLMLEIQQSSTAYNLLSEAKKLISRSDKVDMLGYIDLNMGKCKIQSRDYEDASILLYRAVYNFRKNNNIEEELTTLCHIGEVYNLQDEYDKAEQLLKQAIVTARQTKQLNLNIRLLIEYSKSLWKSNRKQSIKAINEAIQLAVENEAYYVLHQAYQMLSEYYEQMGNYQESLKYLKLLEQSKLVYQNERHTQRSQVIATLYNVEALKYKQQLLEKQSELDRANLDHLQNQLTMKTNSMLEQLKAVHQLRSEVLETLTDIDTAEGILGKVKQKLNNSAVLRLNWQSFADMFDQVHPTFARKLVEQYPNLTKTEVKVCVMVRAGMSSADMAQLLYVSERNIENHRLRIRKKMHLATKNDNLYTVLTKI